MFENNYPELEDIPTPDLPKILMDFYPSLRKSPKANKGKSSSKSAKELDENEKPEVNYEEEGDHYKNSSLKCIRAALNRYFKEACGLNIIENPIFIQCYEMFKAVTKQGKESRNCALQHHLLHRKTRS